MISIGVIMNKAIAFMVFVSFLLLPGLVQAACSIGANPLSMDARAVPGQTVTATWNLYNIHGDRITHVKIGAAESYPGWEISFEPELHEATYNVTGVLQTIEENVGLRPTEVVDFIPDPKPEGMDYVRHPKEDGYIPVRPVDIFIKVPEDAELWKDYKFTFEAVGNCFMEPGAVVPGIATQLEMTIRTVSGEEFYEVEVPEESSEESPEAGEEGGEEQTPAGETGEQGIGGITGFLVSNASWIGIIIVLIVLLAYFSFAKNQWKGKHWGYSYTPG